MDRPYRVTVECEPDPLDLAFLEQRMAEAAISAADVGDEEEFAVLVRDDDRVVAGASGIIWGGGCQVHVVWVDEPLRSRGLGRALMAEVEGEARRRGCRLVMGLTYDVLTGDYYDRLGYRTVGRHRELPGRHRHPMVLQGSVGAREADDTARAAAVAGIVFAVLMGTAYVLARLAIPADATEREWLVERADLVQFALGLVPFAGIAFLWFIGVMRDRVGALEDRFFSTVLLGSGLLYLAMTFVSVALVGGILTAYEVAPTQAIESGLYDFDRSVVYRTSSVFALRMGAVFMISAGTIWLRTHLLRPWAVLVTYGLALVQLVGVSYSLWVTLILPAWVLLISLVFLITGPRQQPS